MSFDQNGTRIGRLMRREDAVGAKKCTSGEEGNSGTEDDPRSTKEAPNDAE